MTRHRIEPQSPGLLVYTLLITPIAVYNYTRIIFLILFPHTLCVCVCVCVCVCMYVCDCVYIYIYILIYHSARAGCDTRSVFAEFYRF